MARVIVINGNKFNQILLKRWLSPNIPESECERGDRCQPRLSIRYDAFTEKTGLIMPFGLR